MNYSDIKYVAFGDSITYGAEYGRDYKKMAEPYPELVGKLLGFASVDNRGINGATLVEGRQGRACMTERILSYDGDCDLISILLGVNDYQDASPLGTPNDTKLDTVYGALDSALSYLAEKYPSAKVFIMTPYETCIHGKPGTENNAEGYALPDVRDAVIAVAERYSVPVLDLYRDGGYCNEIGTPGSDGIHPSPTFVREHTAPDVAKFIKNILN